MTQRTLNAAKDAVCRYCSGAYPEVTLILLGGSWARDAANEDSDIDVIVLDPDTSGFIFTCVEFESWFIELCVVSQVRLDDYFSYVPGRRQAAVTNMFVEGLVIQGDEEIALEVKSKAQKVIDGGPVPLSEAENQEIRRDLTLLLRDLKHASAAEVPALAAQCHTALAKAAIDAEGGWRGEEKTLRTALVKVAPLAAERLDEGLILACQGDTATLIELGQEVVISLGGELRTYFEQH